MMDAWAAYCLAEPDPKLVLDKYSETKALRAEKKANDVKRGVKTSDQRKVI